ncbi:rhamnose mutarotase [Kockiozyma suomiensis]|uniref:rhamnose mutarotase n=1 Tax=Kockiozyma suomiensis TaxID=1337062 RepID=UPI00334381B8
MVERFPGKRICQIVKVRPEHLAEYKRVHEAVWPEVLQEIRESNIVDYSIHYEPRSQLLIASFKYIGDDWERDSQRSSNHEPTKKWWQLTDGMQQSLVEGSTGSTDPRGWWTPLEEVFRFDS